MARCVTRAQTLNLKPGVLDLCMEYGETDQIDVFLEDDNGVLESLAGWTSFEAVMRPAAGAVPIVDLVPTVVGDVIVIDITPAMKTALGTRHGVWTVKGINPDTDPDTLVKGTVSIGTEVGTT